MCHISVFDESSKEFNYANFIMKERWKKMSLKKIIEYFENSNSWKLTFPFM